jgi:hypothetical protein
MAEQRHTLDAKVLTAFFLAAMPFVAFGSFIVVNQARNLLRESVGTSLEQRAVETKLALEGYVAAVAFTPASQSWDGNEDLQEAMLAAAKDATLGRIRGTTRALAFTTVIADRALGFVVLSWLGAVAIVLQPGYPLPAVLYTAALVGPNMATSSVGRNPRRLPAG